MTSIYDVKHGDYIQVTGSREYKRIQEIISQNPAEPQAAPGRGCAPLHYRSWTVITTDGAELDMWDVARYLTQAEYDEETGRPLPHADPRGFIR